MKKMKIILCLMIMGLILGCSGGGSSRGGNNGDPNIPVNPDPDPINPINPINPDPDPINPINPVDPDPDPVDPPAETILLGEISNPPVLNDAENEFIITIVNKKAIITWQTNGKYYLLTDIGDIWERKPLPDGFDTNGFEKYNDKTFCIRTIDKGGVHYHLYVYDGFRWEEVLLAGNPVCTTKVNDHGFIAEYHNYFTSEHSQTLYVYNETNNTWEKHSKLQDKKMELFNSDNTDNIGIKVAKDAATNELWVYQDGEWECIIDGFASYDFINADSTFFIDSDFVYSLWLYKDNQWEKVFGYETKSAIILDESHLLIEDILWHYNDGSWGIYAPAAGRKFSYKSTYIEDYIGKAGWVSRNNKWVPLPGLKEFIKLNWGKEFFSYINDNTVLVKNIFSLAFIFYDASFDEQQHMSGYDYSKGFLAINENAIIMYNKISGEFVLLEYDSGTKQWQKGSFSGPSLPHKFNEHSFFDTATKTLWVYEDGEWKIKLSEYYCINNIPDVFIATNFSKKIEYILYMYDGDKWNEFIKANTIIPYGTDTYIISGKDNVNNVDVLYWDGEEWKIVHSFEDAVYFEHANYIESADGKLYYFFR